MKNITTLSIISLFAINAAFADCAVKYNRKECFGGWIDADKNGLDTRAEILVRDSSCNTSYHHSGYRVRIDTGCFINAYTNEKEADAHKLEIEHIVPVKYAWTCGARYWTQAKRVEFYNDFDNLTLTDKTTNIEKLAKPLDKWLPPKNQCQYMVRFIDVMKKYDMSSNCIAFQLHTCKTSGCC